MTGMIWSKIRLDPKELSINKVLRCGQLFRWKQINNVWSCSLYNRVIFLKQDTEYLYYGSISPDDTKLNLDTESIVRDYFQLNVNLSDLYSHWSSIDKNFIKRTTSFSGIRMLRQDPWENLISFICSTNNNVKRISKMCSNLCENFGNYLLTYEGIDYYSFPELKVLASPDVEYKLRELGFGYRAKYIQKTSQLIYESNFNLNKLRDLSYEECFENLIKFQGVGPKVADCVCLMSLDKADIVPVDTHVFNFAKRDYKFKSATKTLNKQLYVEIRVFFKELWGPYAGWAHSVLFAADLKDLNNGVNLVLLEVVQNGPNTISKNIKLEVDEQKVSLTRGTRGDDEALDTKVKQE